MTKAVCLAVWMGMIVPASALAAGGQALPPLPRLDLSGTFPVVRAQIGAAEAAARAHPLDVVANGKLAMILDAYQQYTYAFVCYERAHRLDPKSFQWQYDLAWVTFKQGRYTAAAEAFREALDLRPSYLPARLKIGECLLALGKFEAAIRFYQKIVQQYPKSPEAQYGLGRAELPQDKTQDAVAPLERACELFPAYGNAQYALALAYRKLAQPEKANEHFAIYRANPTAVPPAVDPVRAEVQRLDEGPESLIQRGIGLADAGDLQGAIQDHLEALKADPDNVQAHINLIQLYARAGEDEKAKEEYQTAVRLNPNRSDCYYNYGVLMFHLGKLEEAGEAFRKALEVNPYYAEAHNNLGSVLANEGHLNEALGEFRKAVEYRPDYRLAHFQIGRILASQGKYPEAIKELRLTLKPEDGETPGYLFTLGEIYGRAGNFKDALQTLHEARDAAEARGQTDLLDHIKRDLRALEDYSPGH